PLQFAAFAIYSGVDKITRNSQALNHVFVEHRGSAAGDGSHGQFLVAGDPQFADDEYIQRSIEDLRYFVCDRHASPRQRKDERVWTIAITRLQGFTKLPAGIEAIPEVHFGASLRFDFCRFRSVT